ncbi:hypothetical protein L3Y34_019255 [Caenorhabditis briggsae]|uniref:Uncharacterized protein n=1 Tax=Caenorhabditis briggsae TaxID=6238 RepID=A0AAE9DMU1_CAEBR|nr:hypothetical protein L3Y34_019255 [Caenorhabditis briggsae]
MPRPYKILAVRPDCLTTEQKKMIPRRIRRKITWGYKPNMDLNKYTHIVVPKKYMKKENTLLVKDDDLFIWQCVASLANIMPETWFDAILESDNYFEKDHVHMLIHMEYNTNVHNETLLKLKTHLHMGRPRFLTNAKITILDTQNKEISKKKKEWEDIIHSFGAEIHSKPKPDNEKTLLPYNSMYSYKDGKKKVQNSCWILKYEDSKIKSIWKSDQEKYTVVPFRFVLECIARYQILPIDMTKRSDEKSNDGPGSTTRGSTTGSTSKTQISV